MTPSLDQRFAQLVAEVAPLELPGHGATLKRWSVLAAVAAEDLALAKLFEGHTDALAIQAELAGVGAAAGEQGDRSERWGTWAAEPPDARLRLRPDGSGVRLDGRKAWCSGAGLVSHALVTAWDSDGQQCLAAVRMDQPGIQVSGGAWRAVGMGRVPTPDVSFDDVLAVPVGTPGQYTGRPGFWHGGIGIAASWLGGCWPLAEGVVAAVNRRDDPHVAAHLGAIDVALSSLQALLAEAAAWIDAHPQADAVEWALRTRSAADNTARIVLDHAGRALGAGPLCRDATLAQHFADLPVFIRQTHAERDLAELGHLVATRGSGWAL
jgi:alkylation response protein AidB-like acyl-CoA dehydrogenase